MRTLKILLATILLAQPVLAQTGAPSARTVRAGVEEMPAEYSAVLEALGRQGDYKDGVLKVNIPRNDLNVSVAGVATPTPFGFGGWIALIHHHMTTTEPTVYFLHYWGRGPAQALATAVRAAVDQTGSASSIRR